MRKNDVPQDDTKMNRGEKEIMYAVDEHGRYVQVQSRGWQPKDVANDQAWQVIEEDILSEIRMIRSGKRSPLAFHMKKNLMNESLLAAYADLPRWRVKRHLRADIFRKLDAKLLDRYADIFGIAADELQNIPDISQGIYNDEIKFRNESAK